MKLFRIVRSNIASLLITKKVPRRLDAAPVNTKTMCLITKLLYKTNLKSLIVVDRFLISSVSFVLVAERILDQLVLWDRHIHLVDVEVESTIGTPLLNLLDTSLMTITLWIVVIHVVNKIVRLLKVCLQAPLGIEFLTALLVDSNLPNL